jgi:hypothetical protein
MSISGSSKSGASTPVSMLEADLLDIVNLHEYCHYNDFG